MTNYREILRLQSLGLNKTEIAASLGCARNTVAAALPRASSCGLQTGPALDLDPYDPQY